MAEIIKKGRIESQTTLKKQSMSIALIAMLLVGGWYGISSLSAYIFQSNKYDKQDSLWETDEQFVDLMPISFPNFTIDPEVLSGFDPNDIPDWLLQALMGAGALSGDIGDFEDMEQLNNVVFRIYPEDGTPVSSEDRWRYTAYDNYNGDEWTRTDTTNFPLGEISNLDQTSYDNKYTVRIPFSASQSQTSMAMPSAFPTPAIGVSSVDALDNDNNGVLNSYQLFKDSLNGSTIGLTLSSSGIGNASYELLREDFQGGIHGDDTSDAYWNTNSIDPSFAPVSIKNSYLQIPGGFPSYYNSHPYYKTHYDLIASDISSLGATTTYEIANVIRNYLAANFEVDIAFPLERPGTGEDIVEWFLEAEGGLPMDFAAAFVILARGFGVPSRYTFGYNTWNSPEVLDSSYSNKAMHEIKFTNMDAWNEIYFTIDTNGDGQFCPMYIKGADLMMPQDPGDSTAAINVLLNGTFTNQYVGVRGNIINMTFGLDIPLVLGTNASQDLDLYDHTADVDLGTVTTDANGYAEIMINMDNNYVAGAHAISVIHSPMLNNFSVVILVDQVNVVLDLVSDPTIDRSVSNYTNVQAHIYDPVNNKAVKNAVLHPVVIDDYVIINGGTNPSGVKVDNFGYIDENEEITMMVDQGTYKFRVDFNGSYEIDNPYNPGSTETISIGGFMDASSATVPFSVVDPNQLVFDLYINTTTEGSQIDIDRSINKLTFTGYLKQGISNMAGWIDIYDQTYGGPLLVSFYTNGGTGWGSADFTYVGNENKPLWIAGNHELYGVWREKGRQNGTFNIFTDENSVDVIIDVIPASEINTTAPGVTEFTVGGYLWDNGFNSGTGAYVKYGRLTMHFFKDGFDRTDLLTIAGVPNDPNTPPINVGVDGRFSITRGVIDSMDQGEWDLWMDFNGTWDTYNYFDFNPLINDSSTIYKVNVTDPGDIEIELWINTTVAKSLYNPYNPPTDKLFERNEDVNLTVRLRQGLSYLSGQTVNIVFEDGSGNTDSINTGSGGYGEKQITLGNSFRAGFIRFYVEYLGTKTYGQILLNDTFQTILTSTLQTSYSRTNDLITVAGYLRDSISFTHKIGGGIMKLHVYNSNDVEVTNQIGDWVNGFNGYYRTLETGVNKGSFTFQFRAPMTYHGEYNFTVEFLGDLRDTSIQCSANYLDPLIKTNSSRQETIIYANIQLSASYLPTQPWTMWEYVNVTGTLIYDNGTSIASGIQSVNITFVDSSNILCNFDSYNDTATWIGNTFDADSIMHWNDAVNIYVEFYDNDDNGVWIMGKKVLVAPG